jgi:Sec-independent protein translocase protein TatA
VPADLVVVLILILIIVVIWRGPKTIPEIGRMFGQGVREARAEANKLRSSDDDAKDESATPPS